MFATVLGVTFLLTAAQAAPPTPPAQKTNAELASAATPADPAERLEVGRRLNGLAVPGAKPWHLKATYQLYDDKAKPTESGTYEEWWFSDKQYKLAYHSATFNQEEYSNDRGVFRAGDQGWQPWPLSRLRDQIEYPILPADELSDRATMNITRKFGDVELACTVLPFREDKHPSLNDRSYCFDSKRTILRYSHTAMLDHQMVYDQITLFDGRFVARSIRMLFTGALSMTLHIDELALLQSEQVSVTKPPDDAQQGARRVLYYPGSEKNVPRWTVQPEYPPVAAQNHIRGTVLLVIRAGTNGHVSNAFAIEGPDVLRKAALDAALHVVFKPLHLNGQPAEFEQEIECNFAMVGSSFY